MGSYHYPVLSSFGRSLIVEIFENVKWFDFARADWDKFMEGTAAALGEVDSSGSLEDHNDVL